MFLSNSSSCAAGNYNSPVYNLTNGQFSVSCSKNVTTGIIGISSTGYVPSQNACSGSSLNCLGKRTISGTIPGSVYIDTMIYANQNFNWNSTLLPPSVFKSYFNGDIAVTNNTTTFYGFNGDGNGIFNQAADQKYDPVTPANDLPPAILNPSPKREGKYSSSCLAYPQINQQGMDILRSYANNYWPGYAHTVVPNGYGPQFVYVLCYF